MLSCIKRFSGISRLTVSWSLHGERRSWQGTLGTFPHINWVNTHPSLLPKYRGPNPYWSCLAAEEDSTGLTFHQITAQFDQGPLWHQAVLPIYPQETGDSLRDRVAHLATLEVGMLLNKLHEPSNEPIPQDSTHASYFAQPGWSEALIDFRKSPEQTLKQYRALTPWLPMAAYFNGHWPMQFDAVTLQKVDSTLQTVPGTILSIMPDTLLVTSSEKGLGFSLQNPQLSSPFRWPTWLPTRLSQWFIQRQGTHLVGQTE